uniref:Fucolectin tachylectin-4 pentraxin-1 domain-containing protein n=1 Tax=Sphaeramia orbicularis TaxID=375764 RepID=A0A672Z4A5_9TELE
MTFTRLVEGCCVTVVLPELALSGKATQSSVHANGIPYNAIDGNRASRWNQGSCIHTGPDFNPWWRLDLRKTHKVFSVIITNIVDAHSARLNGAEIRIGDSLENNGNDNPRYFTDHIPAGFTQNFQCPGMDGHYVNVVIPGRGEYLHICEVEVYENVALRGKATQSDRYEHMFGAAYNAIDGNRNSVFAADSCTHTDEQTNPWWRVDLLDSYIITSIKITNRGDCCPERLNGVQIHVGNSLEDNGLRNPIVGTIAAIAAGSTDTLSFTDHVEGRHVILVLPGINRFLTLCEVEVYGYRAPTGNNLSF